MQQQDDVFALQQSEIISLSEILELMKDKVRINKTIFELYLNIFFKN
ncbi:MAG TPA: hypothetical protein PKD83_08915 [Ignavibacteria bacterium]|nr:hypothetical protein [Ignavibacteria bacterium]